MASVPPGLCPGCRNDLGKIYLPCRLAIEKRQAQIAKTTKVLPEFNSFCKTETHESYKDILDSLHITQPCCRNIMIGFIPFCITQIGKTAKIPKK